MNTREDFPAPEEIPEGWANWVALTDEQKDKMAEDYAREQIASAQSEADFEANKRSYSK